MSAFMSWLARAWAFFTGPRDPFGEEIYQAAMAKISSKRHALVAPPVPPAFESDTVLASVWLNGWHCGRTSLPYSVEWWKAPGNITAPDGAVFFRREAVDALIASLAKQPAGDVK